MEVACGQDWLQMGGKAKHMAQKEHWTNKASRTVIG